MSDLRKAFGLEEEPGGTEIAQRQKQAVARAEQLAEQIRREFNQAWGYYKSEVRSYMKMGRLLIEAKSAVPHGAWEEWVSINCPFTSRTASNWMKLARNEERVEEYLSKSETVSDSLSMREVLKAIEPPKPKPPAQDSEEVKEESTYLGVTRTAPYQPKRTLEEHRARETQAEEQTDEVVQGEVVEEEAKVMELVSDVIEGRREPEDLGEYVRTGDTDVEDDDVFAHFSDEERSLLDTLQSGGGIVVNMHDPGPHRNLVAWLKATDQLTKADRSTKWGNPFIIPDDGDRETVVRKYGEIYLPYKTGLLEQLYSMAGTAWGCWCAPQLCHCDVLRAEAEGEEEVETEVPSHHRYKDPNLRHSMRDLRQMVEGKPETNADLLQDAIRNIVEEYKVLDNAFYKAGSPARFFDEIPDEDLEKVGRQLGAALFFVRTIGDFAEQILEERRERAQGQTSFLDEEE